MTRKPTYEDLKERIRVLEEESIKGKRTQEALRDNEEFLRSLMDQMTDGVIIIDWDGATRFANEAALKLVELDSTTDVIGRNIVEFIKPDTLQGVIDGLVLVKAGHKSVAVECKIITAKGQEKWVEAIGTKVHFKGSDGDLVNIRDITDRKQAEERLRESEENYRQLFTHAPAAIYEVDYTNGKFTQINSLMCEYSGYSREELLAMSSMDVLTEESQSLFLERLEKIGRGESVPTNPEFCMKNKDGSTRWVKLNIKFIHKAGTVIGASVVAHDITERKQVEESLKESSGRYKELSTFLESLFDAIPDVLGVQDKQHGIIRYNQAGYDFLGRKQQEVEGKKCFELINKTRPCDICATSEVYKTKKPARVEKYIEDMGIWLDCRSYPVFDEKGNITKIIEHLRDITDLKQAEYALKESEDRFSLAIAGTGAGLWDWDIVNDRVYYSPQWKTMLGYEDHEVEDDFSGWKNLWHPEDTARIEKAVNDYLQGRTSVYEVEHRLRHKDGSWHWILTRGDIHRDSAGRPVRWVGTNIDITERKEAEDEKVKLQAQLAQAQKMEAIGQLAGGVAHDFNNMLNIILGYSQMALLKMEPSGPLNADLQEIMNATKRSTDLVRQLLAFARKQTIAPKVLDINNAVAGTLNMLRKLIGEDIDLLWMPAANLWPVKMDPTQVDQLLANLAVNARDSISGVGKITIETGKAEFDEAYCSQHADFVPGLYVMLVVSDNGCGMDKETCEKIFEPFFTTKEIGKGTGMGLATVYGIVKQNNGFVNVYSEPEKGTTFRIYLPRHGNERPAIDEPLKQIKPLTGTETVLLVEDNEALLKMSKIMLEELGYTVLAAGNPNEAIKLAGQYAGDIHLLVTDVVMPEMSGRDLQKRLSDLRHLFKCLFISGYTANVIAHRGILDEGVNFLQKPFHMEELAAKVREALE